MHAVWCLFRVLAKLNILMYLVHFTIIYIRNHLSHHVSRDSFSSFSSQWSIGGCCFVTLTHSLTHSRMYVQSIRAAKIQRSRHTWSRRQINYVLMIAMIDGSCDDFELHSRCLVVYIQPKTVTLCHWEDWRDVTFHVLIISTFIQMSFPVAIILVIFALVIHDKFAC